MHLDTRLEQFVDAASKNDVATMEKMVAEGFDPKKTEDYDGRTALHLAAADGHLDAVKWLVEVAQVPLNETDRWNGTALTDTIRHDHKDCQEYLKSKGYSSRPLCPFDTEPSEEAASKYRENTNLETVVAASLGDLQRLKELVDQGTAKANGGDYDSRTPIHLAASTGRLETVTFLVEVAGVDVNPIDRFGGTPLTDAIRHDFNDIQEYLLSKGGVSREVHDDEIPPKARWSY
jgi:ankyrin repeat protein